MREDRDPSVADVDPGIKRHCPSGMKKLLYYFGLLILAHNVVGKKLAFHSLARSEKD